MNAYEIWKQYKFLVSTYNTQMMLSDIKMIPHLHGDDLIDVLERLTIHKDINHVNCNAMVGKLEPYICTIPIKNIIELKSQPDLYFNATNPSIIPNPEVPDEFIINVRHVNYHCDEKNKYHCNDPKEQKVHTKAYLYFMDKTLATTKKVILLTDRTEFVKFPSTVEDLEDVRLFVRNKYDIWCTATSRQYFSNTTPQIILSQINYPDKTIVGGIRLIAHDYNIQNDVQKNWLPFIDKQEKLKCIFGFGPQCIIYNIDELTGRCTVAHSYPTNLSFQQNRGGSAPIPFTITNTNVAYMCTVHFAYDQAHVRRKYFHRFIFMNSEYKPVYISRSFTFFKEHDIEFILSCCIASPTSLFFGVGRNDVKAYIMEVSNDSIRDIPRYDI